MLSSASQKILYASSKIERLFLPLLVGAVIISTYVFIHRYIQRHNQSSWPTIRAILITSFLPFLVTIRTMIHSSVYILTDLLIVGCLIFVCIDIFGIGLWYKGKFSWRLMRTYIASAYVTFFACTLIIYLFNTGAEWLLKKDPAYTRLYEKYTGKPE